AAGGLVAGGYDGPRWQVLPARRPVGFGECGGGDGALGGGHDSGLCFGQVGGEGLVEPGGVDGEFHRGLGAVTGRVLQLEQGGIQDAVRGVAFDVREGLAFVWGEGGDVDQADHVAGVGRGVGDDGTAVGVTDGEHRPGDLPDGAGDVGGVGGDAAQRVRDGL